MAVWIDEEGVLVRRLRLGRERECEPFRSPWWREAHRLYPSNWTYKRQSNWTYKRQAWSLATTKPGEASDLIQEPTDLYEGNWICGHLQVPPSNGFEVVTKNGIVQRARRCKDLLCGLIDIGEECRMESVDRVAEPDGEADLDDLALRKMHPEAGVDRVRDRLVARRYLRVVNDRPRRIVVDAFGPGAVAKMGKLLVRQSRCSTEQHMSRNSVMAIVGETGGEVGELALRRRHRVLEVHHRAERDE